MIALQAEPWTEPPIPLREIEIKAIIRHRDGYRCVVCGVGAAEHIAKTGKNLDVHRTMPGSKYTIEGSQTLCRRCHKKRHFGETTGRAGRLLHVWLPVKLYNAVREMAKAENCSLTALVTRCLRRYLAANGRWPWRGNNED